MKLLSGIIIGILCFVFTATSFVNAEESDIRSVNMEKLVVTATRSEISLEKLPMSVTVITADEIEKMPAKTVDEVLDKAVGLQVRRNKGLANTTSHTTIYMRGTGDSSRVLVLKDGVPLNMAYTGTVSLWNTISLDNIERIEIVRGASSALYGSSAMGGVINIITKTPEKAFSGNLSVEAGSLDTYIANVSVTAGADNFAFRASGEYKETGGYEYYDSSSWKDYYETPENKLTSITLGGDFKIGKSLLRLDYDHLIEDSLTTTSTQYDGEQENNDYMIGWGMPAGPGDVNIKAYYYDSDSGSDARKYNSTSKIHDTYYYNSSIPKDEYGVMLQYSAALGANTLSLGSDLKWAECTSEYAYAEGDRNFSGKQDFYSLFVNDEISLMEERLVLSAGIRYDKWENHSGTFYDSTTDTVRSITYPETSQDAVSPRAGIVYRLTDAAKLRMSFATGFKAPSLYYMYKSGPHGSTRFDLANPDLKAEKMTWSYDLGLDIDPNENLSLSMTFYQNNFEDFLGSKTLSASEVPDWFSPDEGMAVVQSVNLGRVAIHGVEAGLRYQFNPRWSAFVNHTYNVSKIDEYEDDPEIEGNYLSYTPRHQTKIGLTYDNPELFSMGIFITNVGERYGDLENTDAKKLGAYQLVDLKVSRRLVKGIEIYGSVNNLTDEEYKEYYTTYNPPLTAMIGISCKY
jgi:outer membrane receptor protein involved in Fe transport